MTSDLLRIPETLPPGFDQQLDAVNRLTLQASRLATGDEMLRGAQAMGMMGGDGQTIMLGEDDDPANAKLIEWLAFCIRRGDRPLIQVLAEQPGTAWTADESAILAALAASHWSLLRIESLRPDIGRVLYDIWNMDRRVVSSRRLSHVASIGDHILTRWVTDGNCTTLTALISIIRADAIAALATHRLDGGRTVAQVIADNPTLQEDFAIRAFSSPRPQMTQPVLSGNRMRNQPCPCGSGRKYKHCCGKGR